MPGVHTHIYNTQLNLKIYTNPWPRIMDSAGKRKGVNKWNGPVHGPPLQARVAAANGTVLQLANMLVTKRHDDPGAHGNGTGAKQK